MSNPAENVTDRFIDELYTLAQQQLSDHLLHRARRCLLDYLGCTFAGAQMLRSQGQSLLGFLGVSESAHAATVIGFGCKSSLETAALINGMSSHAAELDDGVRFGMVHPGTPVLSALLPVAEQQHVSGLALLKGIVLGYEATVRLACAIQPHHYTAGHHPTATCGTIGAAVGIAAMLGFSKSQLKIALSSAAISASGTLKVLEQGSELKPVNAGRAAVNGLIAASIAKAGLSAPDDALGGESGFLSMMAGTFDATQLYGESVIGFGIEKVYVKPYAACRHAHSAIEAAMSLRSHQLVVGKVIDRIKVTTYKTVIGKHDHNQIHGVASAKMSIPFSVAAALVLGTAGMEAFTENTVEDARIIALTDLVTVIPDDQLSALVPAKRVAILEIETSDGCQVSQRVEFPKGEPENPISDVELMLKFSSLSTFGGITEQANRKIIDEIWVLAGDTTNFFSLLK